MTSHKQLEVILARHLASTLAVPILLIDASGRLLFYNEAAESIFGGRFEEMPEKIIAGWADVLQPQDERGMMIPAQSLAALVVFCESKPIHQRLSLLGPDQVRRRFEMTALPLAGIGGKTLASMAIFAELAK